MGSKMAWIWCLPAEGVADGAIEAVAGTWKTSLAVPDGLAEAAVELARSDASDDEASEGAIVAEGREERMEADVGACD
jgi:hypothetical protein